MVFLLKLTICWSFFALLYILLLRRETFFRANRFYLLGTLVAGILLAAFSDRLQATAEQTGIQVIALPVVTAGLQQATQVSQAWQFMDYVWFFYIPGVVFMLARTGWGIAKLIQMAGNGISEPLPGGVRLIRSTAVTTPFSFFNWIFVPSDHWGNTPEMNTRHMLAHERAHAKGWHSLDIMLMECICALCWFHPLAYWYRRSLRTVHEYLADAQASRLTDKKQYGLLLIRQSQSGMPVAFANHFFQSPLKQRLIMLMKKHSAPVRAFRYALVLPLTILFVLMFQKAPAIAQAREVYTFNSGDPVRLGTRIEDPKDIKALSNPTECDKTPEYPGGMEALIEFITKNMKYPAPVNGVVEEGDVVIAFTVKEDGHLQDVHLSEFRSAPALSAAYEAEALRVISMLPNWIPGKKACKPANYTLTIPIRFRAGTQKTASQMLEGTKELFDVEKPPVFPGGDAGMMKYLAEKITLPKSEKNAAPGVMAFKFIVSKDGHVADVELVKDGGTGKETQEHIMQVIKDMPAWTPAQKDGKPVAVHFTLPVRIALD